MSSDKRKLSRRQRDEKQEKQAKAVIRGIIIVLALLAIGLIVYSTTI